MKSLGALSWAAACMAVVCATSGEARAAGVLLPQGAGDQTPAITDHAVKVFINNGFARIEVRQTFRNPNPHAIDAI